MVSGAHGSTGINTCAEQCHRILYKAAGWLRGQSSCCSVLAVNNERGGGGLREPAVH